MIFTYDDFSARLNEKLKNDQEFYNELLVTIINNPARYVGLFRLSSAKTKLLQNVTQSREIKLGDFLEDIITEYISKLGYTNMEKSIPNPVTGTKLEPDQLFSKNNTIVMIEQKIRDDHDSTKRIGQYDNFEAKYRLLQLRYPERTIRAVMWFIDDTFTKNRSYYLSRAASQSKEHLDIAIYYGSQLFSELFHRPDVWEEITDHLSRHKQERSQELLAIPDLDTSEEFLIALQELKRENPRLLGKLQSNTPIYIQLRNELFPSGVNFRRLNEEVL